MGNAARSCAARGLVAKSRVLAGAVTTVVVFSLVSAVPASAASTAWAVVASPSPGPDNSLNAVSCATSRWCVSVGGYADAVTGLGRTLVETWDGTSWRIVPSPNVGAGNNDLFGVSCVTARSCVAVGYYLDPVSGALRTLVENWDGNTWTITPSPTPGVSGYLTAVSCATARSCVAVGVYQDAAYTFRTLAETWDGTTWTVAAIPTPGSFTDLRGVSCVTARSCVAVGVYDNLGISRTLVETWDGTSWRIVPSPNVGAGNNGLFGVSCATPRSCVAVGVYDNLGPGRTLVETWDGKTWTVTPSPTPGLSGYLSAVSCATATSCVAVGFYTEDWNSPFRTLVETWDGAAWTIVPSPSPGTTFNFLNGVSCPIPTACVAVGNVTSAPGTTQQTLVLSNMATPQV
jgi:hypothetical protein